MDKSHNNIKIQILLEEYKRISNEISVYVREMMRCFIYGAAIAAINLGWGMQNSNSGSGILKGFHEYLPYGFVILAVYFLSLSYIRISLSKFLAHIETDINKLAGHNLLTFESVYVNEVQSKGVLQTGMSFPKRIFTPMMLLAILVIIATPLVFVFKGFNCQKQLFLILIVACVLLAGYVFFCYPKLLDRKIFGKKVVGEKDK